MQLILKPTAQPELDEILVNQSLFAIGRQEEPFRSYPKSLTAKLSKRHARLFAQDERIYVADLGSLNGTRCNDTAVKNVPQEINDGDTLSFGGLEYQVSIVARPEVATQRTESAIRLVLTPEYLKDSLEPIVISSFPFLVNKHSDVFERYKDSLPEQLSYISRRHAHIFMLDDELCIEDLGSTNGTYVDGKALDEHVHPIRDGNLIGFGSDQFVYRVHLLRSEAEDATIAPDPELAESIVPDDPTRTIFVDSPTSFIDVYFVESDRHGEDDEEDGAADAIEDKATAAKPSLARQLTRAFFGERLLSPVVSRSLLAVVAAAGIGAGYYYWQGASQRNLDAALKAQEYERALGIANTLLARDDDNKRLQNQGVEAMIGFVVPQFSALYRADDLAATRDLLDDAGARSANNPQDDALLDILSWSVDVREYLRGRRGNDSGDPFADAAKTQSLLSFWLADSRQHTRELGQVNQLQPDFANIYSDIFADLRSLRNLDIEYQALRDLAVDLDAKLTRGDVGVITEEVNGYFERFPQLRNGDLLREDLRAYGRLQQAIKRKDWRSAHELVANGAFKTAPFTRYVADLSGTALPDAATMERYNTAIDHWRNGDFETSAALLTDLTQGDWGTFAQARLTHQTQLQREFDALRSAKGTPGFESRLFDFYAGLDSTQDQALIEQLKPDFQASANAARVQAGVAERAASQAWERYQRAGGIKTELRLETRVSQRFTDQARLLRDGAANLRRSVNIYTQLGDQPDAENAALYADLMREVALQRSALRNLEVVPWSVRERKLELLPENQK